MMIEMINTEIVGWEAAIRGMRNPMNSWEKSDSVFEHHDECDGNCGKCHLQFEECSVQRIGDNDRDLMIRLRNAGADHRKFMRMINVYVDITAPLYWWKEFDTYKVGTVANSCSTMHKIAEKEFTLEDFSCEHLMEFVMIPFTKLIECLNVCRENYLETRDKKYWWQVIQFLPSSYNQKRTVMLNYEVLANIYKSRKEHKLDEWREFCDWIEKLSYSELITGLENEDAKIEMVKIFYNTSE